MRGMEDGEDGTAPWSALATELRRSLAQPAEDHGLQMPVALILVVTVQYWCVLPVVVLVLPVAGTCTTVLAPLRH
jgi:hypothetical protein